MILIFSHLLVMASFTATSWSSCLLQPQSGNHSRYSRDKCTHMLAIVTNTAAIWSLWSLQPQPGHDSYSHIVVTTTIIATSWPLVVLTQRLCHRDHCVHILVIIITAPT
jgi:hypothetical protein